MYLYDYEYYENKHLQIIRHLNCTKYQIIFLNFIGLNENIPNIYYF